jgi:hypothetical protein
VNPQRHFERSEHKRRRTELTRRGIQPTRNQYVYFVTTTEVFIPDWMLEQAAPGLVSDQDGVWLRGSSTASLLMKLDRDEGGKPECTRIKVRKCKICGQWKLNILADALQRKHESAFDGRQLPCGPECVTTARLKKGAI